MVGVSKVRGDAFREDTSSANIAIQAFTMTASTFAHCSTTSPPPVSCHRACPTALPLTVGHNAAHP